MPKAKAPAGVSDAAKKQDAGVTIPRLKLGEQGVLGLRVFDKRIYEEAQVAFRYPNFIKTVREMQHNPTVGAAMNIYRLMISRVKWDVAAPEDSTEVEKERAALIRSMMDDMDESWASFIESIVDYLVYGFAINEIVLRRRLPANGSRYSDGLVGLKRLAPRSQETICGWKFSDDGAELVGVEQSLANVENQHRFRNRTNADGKIEIPREKFLLFSASATKGNPEGNSILKNIYLSFKRMEMLNDQALLTAAKDISGALKIEVPPQYLSPDASPDQQTAVAGFKSVIDNYQSGQQKGMVVPQVIDPETKQKLFDYSLLESKGSSKVDIEEAIKRYQLDILSALSCDVLRLGQDGTGSFSLASEKSSVLALAIDYRLKEISEVLNTHLMRTLFAMNGWNQERLPKFVYSDIEEIDLDSFSAAVQRIFATSAIEIDRDVMNKIRAALKIPLLPADEPVDKEKLPATMTGQSSRSGDGMAVGTTGQGTRKNGNSGSGDASVGNKENSP